MDTDRGPGFYKYDSDELLHAQNYVLSGNYNLYIEQKDSYQYPIGGWYWFENEAKAREFFNLPPLIINENGYLNAGNI
jgi:hypothetical protein